MPEIQTPKLKPAGSGNKNAAGRLFFLDASAGRILAVNADGSDKKVLVTGCRIPDGVVVDAEAGHIYWTNMGVPSRNDGSIERADLDGQNRTTIVPEGATFTPKQLHLDKENGKLYWCDREGMRVMRSNLDGSQIETLVDTSKGDPRRNRAARSELWHQREIDEWHLEFCALACVHKVAVCQHCGSTADGGAMHRGDDWFVEVNQRSHQASLRRFTWPWRILQEILHIVASAE